MSANTEPSQILNQSKTAGLPVYTAREAVKLQMYLILVSLKQRKRTTPIPEIFTVKNDVIRYQPRDGGKDAYAIAAQGKVKDSDCIACGQCEAACPQQLEIIELLRETARVWSE